MQQAEIPSFKALGRAAGVSDWQIEQLRQGKAAQMRVEVLVRLSTALQVSLLDLLEKFSELPSNLSQPHPNQLIDLQSNPLPARQSEAALAELDRLRQEYQRLQTQLEQQKTTLQQEFQQTTLRLLESWLIQFPSLVFAAQQNPQFPAKNFLVFKHPIEQLLKTWGVEAIGPVGTKVPYDPRLHQLLEGTAQPGDLVEVRYTGYRQGEMLLYRAKVRVVTGENSFS